VKEGCESPRAGLRRCSCNSTAARISSIRTRTITSEACQRRRDKEVDRSRIKRAAKMQQVEKVTIREGNSDSERLKVTD
jgi:hypothetical protein